MMITGESVPMVLSTATMGEALTALDAHHMGAVFITDDQETLLGLLTDGDIRHALAQGECSLSHTVTETMTRAPHTIAITAPVYDALNLMETHQITVLPATDTKGRIKGLLHLHDILGKGAFRFNGM